MTLPSRSARFGRCFRILAVALLLWAAVGPASHASEPYYAARVGVFYDCLSIRNDALVPGTPVTIIRFNHQEDERFVSGDTRERRIAARIAETADRVSDCPSWVEDRTAILLGAVAGLRAAGDCPIRATSLPTHGLSDDLATCSG